MPRRNSFSKKEVAMPTDIKTFLIGDTGVGKSSLLLRFCDGTFDNTHIVTIGVDFKCQTVSKGSHQARVQVWDTAGQERFRTITPAYYRSADGVALIYDITDRSTFESIREWINDLDEHNKDCVRVLIGNKSDLGENRQVSEAEAKAFADEHGMVFFETSAKTGENVEQAFEEMTWMCAKSKGLDPDEQVGKGNEKGISRFIRKVNPFTSS